MSIVEATQLAPGSGFELMNQLTATAGTVELQSSTPASLTFGLNSNGVNELTFEEPGGKRYEVELTLQPNSGATFANGMSSIVVVATQGPPPVPNPRFHTGTLILEVPLGGYTGTSATTITATITRVTATAVLAGDGYFSTNVPNITDAQNELVFSWAATPATADERAIFEADEAAEAFVDASADEQDSYEAVSELQARTPTQDPFATIRNFAASRDRVLSGTFSQPTLISQSPVVSRFAPFVANTRFFTFGPVVSQ